MASANHPVHTLRNPRAFHTGTLAAMPGETKIEHRMGVESRSRHPDEVLATLAAEQHGVVARRQLLAGGISRRAIERRVGSGHLRALGSGVYAVGHVALPREGRWMAAVLAAGPAAVLSHRSAAVAWRLARPGSDAIHVTAPRYLPDRPGVIRHRCDLADDEITVEDSIPVTTVARTILDLAAVASRRELENILHEAEYLRLHHALSVPDLLERHPGRRGSATLRAIFAERTVSRTRSPLEDRFLLFLERAGLPRPELNAPMNLGDRFIEVDCVWRKQRLIVELDGRAAHDTDRNFEGDRTRDRALLVAGWRVMRITWRQLRDPPERLVADLRSLLGDYPSAP